MAARIAALERVPHTQARIHTHARAHTHTHKHEHKILAKMTHTHAGDLSTVQMLVESGADVNNANQDEETPLHWASASGHPVIVRCVCSVVMCVCLCGADSNLCGTGLFCAFCVL